MQTIKPIDLNYKIDGQVGIRRWDTPMLPPPAAPARTRTFKAKDGWLMGDVMYWPGRAEAREWLNSEGFAEGLFDPRWDAFYLKGEEAPAELVELFRERFASFCAAHTVEEMIAPGQARGVHMAPVNSARELVNDPHLAARGFFREVEHPELGRSLVYPGAPYQLSETPWTMGRRAPLPGEHNDEIYKGELGLSDRDIASLTKAGVIQGR